jgi:hypothetical protein
LTELAWYFNGRLVYPSDHLTAVNSSLSPYPFGQKETNISQIGIKDGDTLDVLTRIDCSSTDEDEQWMAHLEVTEEKIDHLQTEVDFKRAELEAAAKENESVAAKVSAIRSSIYFLRQKVSPRTASRDAQH